jgi:hypothetical protein
MTSEGSEDIYLALTRIVILNRCHHLLKEQISPTQALNLAHPRAPRALSRASHRLKRWRNHFLEVETSAQQFARVDD